MSFCNSYKFFIFTLYFPVFLLPLALSSPISGSPFEKFIHSLIQKECIMPEKLTLPFAKTTDPSPFSYLDTPLSQCQTSDISTDYEVKLLCTEVFEVIKNITCVRYDESLPTIESTNRLSENVCEDFESLKGILPEKDNNLSGRLTDKVTCRISCSVEKYEQLCKTLLWSYDTLIKIKNYTLSTEEQVQENGNESVDQISSHKVSSSVKPSSTSVTSKPVSQITKESDKPKDFDDLNPEEKSNLSQIAQDSQNNVSGDTGEITSKAVSSKTDSSNPLVQDEALNKTSAMKNVANAILQNKSEPENEKLAPEVSEVNVKPIESKDLSSLNPESEPIDDENKINVDEKHPQKEAKDNNPQANLDKNSVTSNVSGIKENQNIKNATTSNLSINGNDNIDSKQINGDNKDGSKPSDKSAEQIIPATENDNELKNDNFPDEDKSKVKQTNAENQEEKKVEKTKETVYEGSNEVSPDNDSKLRESSTQSTIPDEYDDIESENDYPKSEYGNVPNLPSKSKETDEKSSIAIDPMANRYDSNINPNVNVERIAGMPFPEQEDSHFFFYFLSIVLIIMAGYLIFHNKQKIIALIVEGRHERRRRSGVGYKKLETK